MPSAAVFVPGQTVEAQWPAVADGFAPDWPVDGLSAEQRRWYPATVVSVRRSGGRGAPAYALAYADGGKAEGVGASHVRLPQHATPKKRTAAGLAAAADQRPVKKRSAAAATTADASESDEAALTLADCKKAYLAKHHNSLPEVFGRRSLKAMTTLMDEIEKRCLLHFHNYWQAKPKRMKVIKYLIVAEAPPFPTGGDPDYLRYLYRPYPYTGGSFSRDIMAALGAPERLRTAVFPDAGYSTAGEIAASSKASVAKSQAWKIACTDWLSEQGIVMIDTLPLSMKYASAHRQQTVYRELAKAAWSEYALPRLEREGFTLAPDCLIFFTLKSERANPTHLFDIHHLCLSPSPLADVLS